MARTAEALSCLWGIGALAVLCQPVRFLRSQSTERRDLSAMCFQCLQAHRLSGTYAWRKGKMRAKSGISSISGHLCMGEWRIVRYAEKRPGQTQNVGGGTVFATIHKCSEIDERATISPIQSRQPCISARKSMRFSARAQNKGLGRGSGTRMRNGCPG